MAEKSTPDLDFAAEAKAEKAGALLMAARMAMRKGQRDKAREQLKQAFALAPGDADGIELLGDIYMAEGEQQKAIELFERALERFPGHTAFEEKMALCHIDLAQMESDKVARQMLLESGDKDKILERNASKAAGISLVMPGAGQFYNDEPEKAYVFLGVALLALIGWTWPLAGAIRTLQLGRRMVDSANVFGAMGGAYTMLFWVTLVIWIIATVASMVDAARSAKRINEDRRRSLGL